jgi:hypothetical protein
MSAATTLERVQCGEVLDPLDERGAGVGARVGGVQAVGAGEDDQAVGADQDRHLSREEVVVAEADLVSRRRVVLVDHRDNAPLEQFAQRLARVQIAAARADVEERKQHLRGHGAMLAEQLVIDAIEPPLADGAGRLQLLDRGRARAETEDARTARDRAAGHDHDLIAALERSRDRGADLPQQLRAQLPLVCRDDRRAELDHRASHCRRRLVERPACSQPPLGRA